MEFPRKRIIFHTALMKCNEIGKCNGIPGAAFWGGSEPKISLHFVTSCEIWLYFEKIGYISSYLSERVRLELSNVPGLAKIGILLVENQ